TSSFTWTFRSSASPEYSAYPQTAPAAACTGRLAACVRTSGRRRFPMGDDGMRQDLKRAFGDLTEPPDSGMRHRVMNAVRAGGESGPRHQWAVALATAVITVALVGGFLLTRLPLGGSGAPTRSEERRVGKGWRARR